MQRSIKARLKEKAKTYSNYIVIFLLVLFVLSLARNILRIGKAGKRISDKEERVQEMKEENEALKKRLEEVQSSHFTEKQLRDNLGLVKEGEIVIVLPDEDILRSLSPDLEEEKEALPDPNWRKWLKLFI